MDLNIYKVVANYVRLFSDDLVKQLDEEEIRDIFYHLSHQEEKEIKHRDSWGNWDYPYTNYNYTEPYLDLNIQSKLRQLGLKQKKLWPDEKRFAFCITHDIDHIGLTRLQESQRFRTKRISTIIHKAASFFINLSRRFMRGHKFWCFEKLINFLEEKKYKSTFFIYVNPSDVRMQHKFDNLYELTDILKFYGKKMKVGEFVKELDRKGFEIGLHGSYLSATNDSLFNEQKIKIESLLGKRIYVTRQHYLRYDTYKTPLVHINNNMLVDSTLGFNRAIGFRAGTCMPYFLYGNNGSSMLEIPMIIMDGALFTANAMELNEDLAIRKSIQVMDYCETSGGVFTINFHPNYINNDMWWNVFKAIVNEAHKRNAYNATLKEIYDCVAKSLEKELSN